MKYNCVEIANEIAKFNEETGKNDECFLYQKRDAPQEGVKSVD